MMSRINVAQKFLSDHELPFAAREAELQRLREEYEFVLTSESPSVVVVQAESGFGKTRLVREFLESLAKPDSSAAPRAAAHAELTLEVPEVDASIIEILSLTARRFHKKYLSTAPAPAAFVEPFLAAIEEGLKPSPQVLPQLFRRAVRDLAVQYPTVIVMEDVHRGDEDLLKELSLCIRSVASLPVLFIITERTEAAAHFRGRLDNRRFLSMELGALQIQDVKHILAGLFGQSDLDVLAFQLHQYSEGNPFYLSELVHELLEQGVVQWKAGLWQLTSPYGWQSASGYGAATNGAPKSLKFLSERRYSQCSPDEKTVLQQLILAGDPAAPERFTDKASAESLIRKGIISRTQDGLLQFSHGLMREFVRTEVSDAEKDIYFAALLEDADTGHPKPCQSSDLAMYLGRRTAPLSERATKFLIEYSCNQSERFLRHRLAESCLVAVLRNATDLPAMLRAEAVIQLAKLEFKLERFEDGLRLTRELLERESLPPALMLEAYSVHLRIIHYHKREAFDAELARIKMYADAHRLHVAAADEAAWAKALLTIQSLAARQYFISGRYAEAKEIYTRLLEHPQFNYNDFPDVAANLSGIEVVNSNFRDAERYARLSLDYYLRLGTEPEIAKALVNLATVLCQEGKIIEAHQCASDAVGRCSLVGLDGRSEKYIFHAALFWLALSNLRLMNYAEAERQLHRCAEQFRSDKQSENILVTLLAFSDFYLETEQINLAADATDEAMMLLQSHPHPLFEMFFLLQKVRVLLKSAQDASLFIEKAEEKLREAGFANWTADVVQVKAEAARAVGDLKSAAELFEDAAARYAKSKQNMFAEMLCYQQGAMALLIQNDAKAHRHYRRAMDLAETMGLEKRASAFKAEFDSHPNAAKLTNTAGGRETVSSDHSLGAAPKLGFIRIEAFNTLSIFRAGSVQPISKREWGSEKPRKFLLYLMLKQGEPYRRTREAVGEALWPEQPLDPKKLSLFLRVALSQTRKALGAPDIIQKANEIYSVNFDLCRADWMEFEKHLAEATAAQRQNKAVIAEAAFQTARTLYTGDFLVGTDDDWVMEKRLRLSDEFDRTLRTLSLFAEARSDYETAIAFTRELLAHNSEHEAGYEDAIRLSGLMGNKVQATKFYEACAEMLREEFGHKPSRSLEETYQKFVLQK
ncbi:MAG: AAA family ATPase [Rhizobacter sp.]|nr:AAA family ATPase [Chlorobiales bacterium]